MSSDSILLILDFPDILCYRGKRRDRARMTAYNASRSSQAGESSSSSSASESGRVSESSFASSTESGRYCQETDCTGTENSERTENEILRYKVKSLKAKLHKTLDCLEQSQYAAARQKRLMDHKISVVVAGLAGGQYIGYENGRVIHKWQRTSDKVWNELLGWHVR